MGNSKKRKKKKKVGYNSLGMIAIALVVLVLLGGLMLESNDLKERLTGYDAKAATMLRPPLFSNRLKMSRHVQKKLIN